MNFEAAGSVGSVKIFTTDNRGFTPEEIAERAVEKLIYVGENVAPDLARQAREFKNQVFDLMVKYLREAQESERKTIRAKLSQRGYEEIAHLIGDL